MSISTSAIVRGAVVLVSFKTNDEKMTIRRPAVIVNVNPITEEAILLPFLAKDAIVKKGLKVEAKSLEGATAGLKADITIDCQYRAKIPFALLVSKIGRLDENIMQKLDKLLEE